VANNITTSGGNVATDQVGDGSHIQLMKIVSGTEDSIERIEGTAANGLETDVTRVPADPFGANIDASSAVGGAGSMQAKLRLMTSQLDALGTKIDSLLTNTQLRASGIPVTLPIGTNNIGDVDVLTLPAIPAGTNNIGDVDVLTLPSLPAGNANIGDVDIASIADPVANSVTAGGLYLALTSANTDPGGQAVPTGAKALVVWFENPAASDAMVRGRIGFNASATAITAITGTDVKLAYSPPAPVQYAVPSTATHVHLASSTLNAVVRGAWLY
jgi:hypothetical protein